MYSSNSPLSLPVSFWRSYYLLEKLASIKFAGPLAANGEDWRFESRRTFRERNLTGNRPLLSETQAES
jgi:hypothetical protein